MKKRYQAVLKITTLATRTTTAHQKLFFGQSLNLFFSSAKSVVAAAVASRW